MELTLPLPACGKLVARPAMSGQDERDGGSEICTRVSRSSFRTRGTPARPASSPPSASRRSRGTSSGSRSRWAVSTATSTLDEVVEHTRALDRGDRSPRLGRPRERLRRRSRERRARDQLALPRRELSAAPSRTTTRERPLYDLGHAVERVAAAVEAARRARLPLHADRARGEPHPRQPGSRRHACPPEGVRGGRRRRPLRAGAANGRGDPHHLRGASRGPSTCSPAATCRWPRSSRPAPSGSASAEPDLGGRERRGRGGRARSATAATSRNSARSRRSTSGSLLVLGLSEVAGSGAPLPPLRRLLYVSPSRQVTTT